MVRRSASRVRRFGCFSEDRYLSTSAFDTAAVYSSGPKTEYVVPPSDRDADDPADKTVAANAEQRLKGGDAGCKAVARPEEKRKSSTGKAK